MPIHQDRILYSDPHILAVNKLAGELVVKGSGRTDSLPLLDFLKQAYPGLRPLNRLDYETSGIVLFARTKDAYEKMREEYKDAVSLRKTYRAIVYGHPKKKEGTIDAPLPSRAGGELVPASTRYKVLELFPSTAYVEASMMTGRHHQIRRHLAKIGHALALDDVYGNEKFNKSFAKAVKFRRFFLHAASVEFVHPLTGEKVVISAPIPRAFETALGKLRGDGK